MLENRGPTVVSVWGTGWAVGSVLVFLVATSLQTWTASLAFLGALPVGSVIMGVPLFFTANEARAAHPRIEATAWVLAFAATVSIYALSVSSDAGGINAVTTRAMHQRSEWASPYPRELVTSLWCFAGFTMISGLASALLEASVSFRRRLIVESAVFVACIALSIACGLLLFVIGGPIFWNASDMLPGSPILHDVGGVAGAAFVSGCLVGAGIRYGRLRLASAHQLNAVPA